MFAVIRHPDVANLGTCPESAYEHHRALGWVRVSDWRATPDLFHLPDFADATEDLDAADAKVVAVPQIDNGVAFTIADLGAPEEPEPEPKPKTTAARAAKSKES